MTISLKDTTAYRLVSQIIDHTWGYDTDWDSEDLVSVYRMFVAKGGSWKSIIDGDVDQFSLLESIIDSHMNCRNIINVTEKLNNEF